MNDCEKKPDDMVDGSLAEDGNVGKEAEVVGAVADDDMKEAEELLMGIDMIQRRRSQRQGDLA